MKIIATLTKYNSFRHEFFAVLEGGEPIFIDPFVGCCEPFINDNTIYHDIYLGKYEFVGHYHTDGERYLTYPKCFLPISCTLLNKTA